MEREKMYRTLFKCNEKNSTEVERNQFVCEICKSEFNQNWDLNQHISIVHNDNMM